MTSLTQGKKGRMRGTHRKPQLGVPPTGLVTQPGGGGVTTPQGSINLNISYRGAKLENRQPSEQTGVVKNENGQQGRPHTIDVSLQEKTVLKVVPRAIALPNS